MHDASLLDDLAPVIGFRATCAIAAWWSGRNLYVPGEATEDHPLVSVIGAPALRHLVEAFGNETLAVPPHSDALRYRRDRMICECYAEGWDAKRVADVFDMSTRRAEQIRTELVASGWMAYAEGRLVRRVGPAR